MKPCQRISCEMSGSAWIFIIKGSHCPALSWICKWRWLNWAVCDIWLIRLQEKHFIYSVQIKQHSDTCSDKNKNMSMRVHLLLLPCHTIPISKLKKWSLYLNNWRLVCWHLFESFKGTLPIEHSVGNGSPYWRTVHPFIRLLCVSYSIFVTHKRT